MSGSLRPSTPTNSRSSGGNKTLYMTAFGWSLHSLGHREMWVEEVEIWGDLKIKLMSMIENLGENKEKEAKFLFSARIQVFLCLPKNSLKDQKSANIFPFLPND
jgi:hypothetical protein